MRELTKAAASFSYAASLFGIREGVGLLASREAQHSLYSVRQAMTGQLSDLVWAAFQVGDHMQREAVDWAFNLMTLRAFMPASLAQMASAATWQATETARMLMPGANVRLAWQQLRNNYEVFNLVKHVRALLHVPEGPEFPLEHLVENAYALGEYPDLWAVEGLGHDYADRFWGPLENIRNLLTDEKARALPAQSLTMMHAGMGLSFAQHLLHTVSPFSLEAEIARMLESFITLCRENSQAGYVGAAYESLGLVTRTWNAELIPVIDRSLSQIDEEIAAHFWHGVGRALYFLPIYFVPGLLSPWRTLDHDAPSEAARCNLRAGLAWATTLVNLRQPAIMEGLIARHGSLLQENDAFANGVASSTIMAWDITPGDSYIQSFVRHEPAPDLADQWDRLVRRPCRLALERYHSVLQRAGRLGEVFRYQNLDELVNTLEGRRK